MLSINPTTFFKYLSDETRLLILLLLKQQGALCVCELVVALDLSQPKISRHLALLREVGLLLAERRGKWVYYSLNPQLPAWVEQVLQLVQGQAPSDLELCLCRLSDTPQVMRCD